MKWLKISDELPSFDEWVLVLADNRISVGQYLNWDGRLFWNSQSSEDSCCSCSKTDFKDVTHWLHLPELPDRKQKDFVL